MVSESSRQRVNQLFGEILLKTANATDLRPFYASQRLAKGGARARACVCVAFG
jgi:L-rhamnose isomerase